MVDFSGRWDENKPNGNIYDIWQPSAAKWQTIVRERNVPSRSEHTQGTVWMLHCCHHSVLGKKETEKGSWGGSNLASNLRACFCVFSPYGVSRSGWLRSGEMKVSHANQEKCMKKKRTEDLFVSSCRSALPLEEVREAGAVRNEMFSCANKPKRSHHLRQIKE